MENKPLLEVIGSKKIPFSILHNGVETEVDLGDIINRYHIHTGNLIRELESTKTNEEKTFHPTIIQCSSIQGQMIVTKSMVELKKLQIM